MRLGFPDSSTQPRHTSAYTSHRVLAQGFGAGYDAPLVVVSELPGDVPAVVAAVRRTPGIASVTPARTSRDGRAALFIAYPNTGAQDAATARLVHELRDDVVPRAAGAGAGTREAVTLGLARTARVITAAAAIMVLVFLSVLLGADIPVKEIGLGLGVAVFIDATIVRMVLVPALMELLGRANWWLPGWLARVLPVADREEPVPVPVH